MLPCKACKFLFIYFYLKKFGPFPSVNDANIYYTPSFILHHPYCTEAEIYIKKSKCHKFTYTTPVGVTSSVQKQYTVIAHLASQSKVNSMLQQVPLPLHSDDLVMPSPILVSDILPTGSGHRTNLRDSLRMLIRLRSVFVGSFDCGGGQGNCKKMEIYNFTPFLVLFMLIFLQ